MRSLSYGQVARQLGECAALVAPGAAAEECDSQGSEEEEEEESGGSAVQGSPGPACS